MPTEIKQLIGALDLDSSLETIGKGFHRDARNTDFEGVPPNRRAKIKPGNVAITNSLLPATDVNKTICRKYDPITKRIFFLNYNSGGKHGIYLYNTIAGTFQRLVEVGINTIGDPLAFTAESHTNIDIIYGDSTQGDILYYVDSLGRPSKININRALAGGYGNIQRSYLDVAKEPADIPPYVVYEIDPSNTINNLRKKLFRIKVRWVFDDQDKSVTSSQSVMSIPYNAFDQATDTDPTINCRLAITYQTGPSNVKKIEILVSNSLGNVMSDFFEVASIDKSISGIPDNDVATYLFYNDKGYNDILVKDSIQLFDYVPQVVGAQTLLNGNTLDYANITEGYPNLTNFSDGTNTSTIIPGQTPYYFGNYFSSFVGNQSGKSGFGTGNIHIVIRGIIISPAFALDTYYVYFTDGSSISYTLSVGDDAAAIIAGLRSNAITNGFTIVSVGANDLYITKTNISLARVFISSSYSYNGLLNTSFNAYDWSSNNGFALIYFDQKGRTNGAVYTQGFSVQSSPYTEGTPPSDIPNFTISIYHLPPDWAYYYQWVRTKNLSKQNMVQWISDRTFKDEVALAGLVKYAYLSIESLNAFVKANPGSPLTYGFTPGDRIKFYKRYNSDNSTAYLYYNTKDFEILASLLDPTINGTIRTGQFIKILLPATDGAFDFGNGFDNYFIELYTPAQSVANNLNTYYEFGERYAIGNPTLNTRFHQGQTQNQAPSTNTPATFVFTKGDYYIRLRGIQTGNIFLYSIPTGGINADGFLGPTRVLIGLNFISQTYSDTNITTQSVVLANVPGFDGTSDSRWFIKANINTTFHVQGTIAINFPAEKLGDSWAIYYQNRYNEIFYLVPFFDASNAGTYRFTINTSITLEDDHIFLIAASLGGARQINFLSSDISFTIDHVISQRCIDPNFSDYFPSKVNSNGRAFIYDSNANRVTYPDMYRWSLAYQTNTNINQTSRFYPENFDEANRMYGAIMKMAQLGNELIFFMERKIGHTGVFQKFITDSGGNTSLITTDTIITNNNVQYYKGEIGCGNQPTGVIQSDFAFYGTDPIKNIIWRLSLDGITDLTELYRTKTWASANLPKYLNPGAYQFGGNQKVLGAYHLRPDNIGEYLLLAQGTALVPGETFAFEESNNSFTGKIDIDCDTIVSAENVLYAFKNGVLWKESTANAYAVFFNTQYTASITLVFNDSEAVKKIFNALAYQSNQTWTAPTKGDVKTNTVNSQTFLQQESLIMNQDFDVLENPNRYASFNRNQNSSTDPILSLWEGEYLCGNYIVIKLSIIYNGFSFIYAPFVTWQKDPRNF